MNAIYAIKKNQHSLRKLRNIEIYGLRANCIRVFIRNRVLVGLGTSASFFGWWSDCFASGLIVAAVVL